MKSTFSSFAQNKVTISEEMWTFPTYKVKPAAKQITTNYNQPSTCEALYLQEITLKALLVQCAWAATRTKGTYLRSKYDSLVGRRGKKRALIAIGHKILVATYFILKDKVAYKELGAEYLQELKKGKQIKRHIQLLKELGVDIEIKEVA